MIENLYMKLELKHEKHYKLNLFQGTLRTICKTKQFMKNLIPRDNLEDYHFDILMKTPNRKKISN